MEDQYITSDELRETLIEIDFVDRMTAIIDELEAVLVTLGDL